MEPYILPKLTDAEYTLLMLCKGKYKLHTIAVPVRSVFTQYSQFYAFYNTEYWAGEVKATDIPYHAKEIERLFISLMSELLFKLSSSLFKACILDAFGPNVSSIDKEDPYVLFKALRSYLRLRISAKDYRYLGELNF